MTTPDHLPVPAWRPLASDRATTLVDARLQIHHAAQFIAALGISYLPVQPDDSHTNLGWIDALGALASHPVQGSVAVRLAVRPHPFALLFVGEDNAARATLLLNGRVIDGVVRWIRANLEQRGLNAGAYTLEKHYTIPPHPVADGAGFNAAASGPFEEIGKWFGNAALVLESVVAKDPNASVVRCWPHHFDIATLIEVAPLKTIGVGLEPGDTYYAEPYFYVNMTPAPAADTARPPLAGRGEWHADEWIGAVLRGSRLTSDDQRAQVGEFIDSALAACRSLLLSS